MNYCQTDTLVTTSVRFQDGTDTQHRAPCRFLDLLRNSFGAIFNKQDMTNPSFRTALNCYETGLLHSLLLIGFAIWPSACLAERMKSHSKTFSTDDLIEVHIFSFWKAKCDSSCFWSFDGCFLYSGLKTASWIQFCAQYFESDWNSFSNQQPL